MENVALSVRYHPQPQETTFRHGLVLPKVGKKGSWKRTLDALVALQVPELLIAVPSAGPVGELRTGKSPILVMEAETKRSLLSRKPLVEPEALVRTALDFLLQHHFCQYLLVAQPGAVVEPGFLAHLLENQKEKDWVGSGGLRLASSFEYEEQLRALVGTGWWASVRA